MRKVEVYDMTESNNDKSKDEHENIFKILDGTIADLNKTKKMFLVMILSILIIPPIVLIVMMAVFDSPIEFRGTEQMTMEEFEELREKHSQSGLIFRPPQLVIFAVSLVWVCIGIRQYFVLTKWSKKYDRYKKLQEDVDKKLDEKE